MTTSSSVRNNRLRVVLEASVVLILYQFGIVSSFQHNPNYCPLSGISHSALHRPTTCLWSGSIVQNTADIIITEEEQAAYDWDTQFEKLQLFKEEYRHCNFPQNAPAELNKKYPTLARFCHDQRRDCRRIRRRNLSDSMSLSLFDRRVRCRGLEEMGFEFDPRQAQWYDNYHALIHYHADNGHVRVGQEENLSLFRWTSNQRRKYNGALGFTSLSEHQINLLDRLEFPWKGPRKEWMDMCNELVAFRNKHGHLEVKRKSNTDLNCWIHHQRGSYDRLSEEQVKLLNDIGFHWKTDYEETRWNAKYNKLVEFKNKHGHFWIPVENRSLYNWISHQRRRRAGKTNLWSPLSEEHVKLLDDIEFPWKPDRLSTLWLAKYNELERLKKKHGHCQPQRLTHSKLYHWSKFQRRKRNKSMLSTEQIKLLDKIDFPWETNRFAWASMHHELTDYCNQHGHLRVSEEDDPQLYDWMTMQRKRYHGVNKPAITHPQIELLEEFHFCWSLDWKERTWYEKYTEAVEFYKEHGHTRVKKKDNASLYNWIQTQDKRYNQLKGQKPLSSVELELLEQIDFVFLENQPRMAWNTMYAELEMFREENDGRFPDHKDDPDLNRWMRQQRRRLRSAYGYMTLADEQKSLLESIDFPIFPKTDDSRRWYAKYDELVGFWKQHGHFAVDKAENPGLHGWIGLQRKTYKGIHAGTLPLSMSRTYLLERIGFAWVSDRDEVQWQIQYDELVRFLEREGRFPSSLSEHQRLYKWIEAQRARYKGIASDIPDHQIQQLENIGFRWSLRDS